jgi:hypothetical protein
MKQVCLLLALVFVEIGVAGLPAKASSFTPLEWQQVVEKHSIAAMVPAGVFCLLLAVVRAS